MKSQASEASAQNSRGRTPVQIISGFLGAGKTTAIRAQLEQRKGERIAVIVNDFGEASLDEVELE